MDASQEAHDSGRVQDAVETQPLISGKQQNGRKEGSSHLKLFTSHFLSTWNSRMFEFGAVIYLGSVFSETLLPMSVYALVRSMVAILFASAIGRYIDRADRLSCVRVSIIGQRSAVALSCVVFYLLSTNTDAQANWLPALIVLTFLACIEKACSILNLVSVEKDWVVVIAQDSDLGHLNARMRQIDLCCKLMGPLFVTSVAGFSLKVAIIANFALNIVSVPVEYFTIARVYKKYAALQIPKSALQPENTSNSQSIHRTMLQSVVSAYQDNLFYVKHPMLLPSMALSCLYFTVLSFGGQMVTFLIAAGFSTLHIGLARTAAVIFEISATFIHPALSKRFGPIRVGLWAILWQTTALAVGTFCFFYFGGIVGAVALVLGTIFSRTGLWGFDLSVQATIQDGVSPENRGKFSAIEAGWQSAFEMLSYVSTMIFYRPKQFRWPALLSVIAGILAACLYSVWARRKRGHLLHLDRFGHYFGNKAKG